MLPCLPINSPVAAPLFPHLFYKYNVQKSKYLIFDQKQLKLAETLTVIFKWHAEQLANTKMLSRRTNETKITVRNISFILFLDFHHWNSSNNTWRKKCDNFFCLVLFFFGKLKTACFNKYNLYL